MTDKYEYKVTKGKDFRIDVEVTVKPEIYQQYEDSAYERLAADVKIQGFREGKAPKAQILAKIGSTLVSEAIKDMVPVVAAEIVDADKLSPITTLEYDVTKVNADGSVTFSFGFTNYPDIKIGDFSKLKVADTKVEVTDADIEEVKQRLFKQPQAHDHSAHDHDHEHHDHDHEHDHTHEHADAEADAVMEPVEVTPEMIEKLGIDDIKTVEDLNNRIREQLETMKKNEAEDKVDGELLAAAIAASDIPLPDPLIDQQAAYMVDDYVSRIEQLGVDIEGFLQAQGTSMDTIREQKREQAKTKLSQELVMNEIIKKYELTPQAEDIENEIKSITDPEVRHSYDNYQGRRYVLSVLIQRRAMQKLRELAGLPTEAKK